MFAVIKTGGKQYKVAADDVLNVEKLDAEAGDTVTFDQVLMVGAEGDVTIGAPLVDGASVVAELVEQKRDKKIVIFKKKRRQNYRRKNGHRQHLSVVRITDILTGGAKPKATKKAAPKKEAAKETAKSEAPAAKADAKDDLKLISGVGPALEKKLHAAGVTSLKQVAEFTKADIERIDAELNFKGRIEREDWISQAKELMAGK
ncbi:50S ribosomal protein L21 [Maritalea myrionectae]|mgnify:CR=1 FL=1|uniref:Large ribosomal subunit protein bL21 n=1 Tax=Maritalea myrionectae TaxID=454601 RepID=A0A2R4MHN7_9HYPH|nr:50S ribosomal protein L21 [Maritalea myrionectae]AVX05555.1 50S ribosomal protein L21 [Maritalea myrionectae]